MKMLITTTLAALAVSSAGSGGAIFQAETDRRLGTLIYTVPANGIVVLELGTR